MDLPPQPSFERLAINGKTGDINDKYKLYNVINVSIYDVLLKWWLQYFPLDQFLFLTSEDLMANPAKELQKVERFLGLRHVLTEDIFYFNKTRGFYCMCVNQRKLDGQRHRRKEIEQKCLSDDKGRTHPSIDPHVINKLRDFFRPHNERLYQMIGINFGWK